MYVRYSSPMTNDLTIDGGGQSGTSPVSGVTTLTIYENPLAPNPAMDLVVQTYQCKAGANVLLLANDKFTTTGLTSGSVPALFTVSGEFSSVATVKLQYHLTVTPTGYLRWNKSMTVENAMFEQNGRISGMNDTLSIQWTTAAASSYTPSVLLHKTAYHTTYWLETVTVGDKGHLEVSEANMVVQQDVTVGSDCEVTFSQASYTSAQWLNVTGNVTMGQFAAGGPATTFYVHWLRMYVGGAMTIDENVAVNGNGLGYPAESGPGAGGGASGDAGAGGAGHAGLGATGSGAAGAQYGLMLTPRTPGSGGGSVSTAGGAGGGAFALFVQSKLTVLGSITMNGAIGGSTSGSCCS